MSDGQDDSDLMRISATLGQMRMLIGRRLIGRMALENVAPELDLSDLDVLGLVPRDAPEGTGFAIGDVARAMRVDPSRASRIVTSLTERGFLRRVSDQTDARRTMLCRTPEGDRIFAEIRRLKLEILTEILSDWTGPELATFSQLFERFVGALGQQLHQRSQRD